MSPLAPYQETEAQRRERLLKLLGPTVAPAPAVEATPPSPPDDLEPEERDEYVEGDWLSDYGEDTTWRNFVPIYGGYLEAKSLWNEEVSLKQQFKDHPIITTLRLTGVGLDFLPLFGVPGALARGGARMAFRQALIGGAKFRSRPFRWIMDEIQRVQLGSVWVGGKGGKYIKRVGIPAGERAALREAALNARLTDDPGEQLILLAGSNETMSPRQMELAVEVLQRIYKPTATGRAIQRIIRTGEATSSDLKLLDAEAELRLAIKDVAEKVGKAGGEDAAKQVQAFAALRPRIVKMLNELPPGQENRRKTLQGLLDNIPEGPAIPEPVPLGSTTGRADLGVAEVTSLESAATVRGAQLSLVNEQAKLLVDAHKAGRLTAVEAAEGLKKLRSTKEFKLARQEAARAAYKDAIDKGLTKEAATKASRKVAAQFGREGRPGAAAAAVEEIPKTGEEYVWGKFKVDTSHPWVRSGLMDEHRISDASLKVRFGAEVKGSALHTVGQWFKVTQRVVGRKGSETQGGVLGYKAYFDTPSLPGKVGRRGTAMIWDMGEELGEKRYISQIMIGSDKLLLDAAPTLNGAKQIFVDAATDTEVQARAFGHTLRHYMGFPTQGLMSRVGRMFSKRAQAAINRLPNTEGDVILKEMAPTEWSRQTVGRAQEQGHRLKNIRARNRSLEAGSQEAVELARLHLQDEAVEVSRFLYRMYTDEVYMGIGIQGGKQWLRKNMFGDLIVKDKALDKEIFNFMDNPAKYGDKVSEQAKLIGAELKNMYGIIGRELKATSDNPVIQQMALLDNYITHISDEAQRELFGMYSRANRIGGLASENVPVNVYFGFASRTSHLAVGDQSAWKSVSLYMKTAIGVKHGEAAMDKLRLMRRAAIEEGDVGGAWSINQVMAVITGEGHDIVLQDARMLASLIDMISLPEKGLGKVFRAASPWVSKLRWWRTTESGAKSARKGNIEKRILSYNARLTQNLYRGLLYGRLPTALDQFTQFNHTMADIGVRNTIRGISVLGRKMFTKTSIAQGFRETLVDSPLFTFGGGAVGGAAGFVAAGPLGAIIGAAITPAARFVKSQVKGSFANLREPVDVMRRASIQDPARILRGPEYVEATNNFFKYLDEVGFTQIDTAEAILRGASLYGGIDAALRLGFRGRMALEFSVGVVEKTQFTYDQLSRNPVFRHSLAGQWLAPLSSFPLKQMRFVKRILREGGSDGASPMVAMTRYLFFNGLYASMFREAAKAMVGEEMVPRALQSRVEAGFLGPFRPNTGVKAPPGFESMAGFNLARMPGPAVVKALRDWMYRDQDFAHFADAFMKAFMPFGLVFNDAFRARSRMRLGKTYRKEGLYTQGSAWLRSRGSFDRSEGIQAGIERELDLFTPGGSAVRDLPPERMKVIEYGRMLGFVSPREQAMMDRERLLQAYSRTYSDTHLNEQMSQLMKQYIHLNEEELTTAMTEMVMQSESLQRLAGAGWDFKAVLKMELPRIIRLWDDNLKPVFQYIVDGYRSGQMQHAKGNPNGEVTMELFREMAIMMGMPQTDLEMWAGHRDEYVQHKADELDRIFPTKER